MLPTFQILWVVSLTLRDINKLSFCSKFERFVSKNGRQTSGEELSFKSIVVLAIAESYRYFKIQLSIYYCADNYYTSVKMFVIWSSVDKIDIFYCSRINKLFPRGKFSPFPLFPIIIISCILWCQFWLLVIWLVEGIFSVINPSLTL